jgi:hypothetical protein
MMIVILILVLFWSAGTSFINKDTMKVIQFNDHLATP